MNQHNRTSEPPDPSARGPRRASAVWLVAFLLLAYSAVIAMTAGIDVTIAGLRIRSRTWERPALLGLACLIAIAVADRRRAAAAARGFGPATLRASAAVTSRISPRAVATAAAVWALAAGVAWGTYIAGGSDSSGYLNQARLLARGQLVDESRLDAASPWRQSTFTLSPLGYRPARDGLRLAPTYPPGYPLLLAPAFLVDERAAHLVVPLCGALAVWLTFALGRRIGAPGPGAAAAVLLSASPTFLYQLVQPMSDVPATAAWLLALDLAARGTTRSAALSGLVTGLAILIRPNLMPIAVLLWGACALADGRPAWWRRALVAGLATAPGILLLALIRFTRYGSALESGYAPMRDLFSLANIGPNLERYPRWLFETHTPLIALFLLAPLWAARRREPHRGLWLILWAFAVAVAAAYLPYVYFKPFEWTYIRFLLPAIPLMWLLVLTPAMRTLNRARAGVMGLVIAPALILLAGFSIFTAHQRYAFGLWEGETKYVEAAEYVRRELPPNAILFSLQHSGSLWFYTRRPILRWDHIDGPRLDERVAWAKAHGYAPFFVIDAEEFERIKERFGPAAQRSIARPRPLAVFGDARVYALE